MMGEYLMTQNDVLAGGEFEDTVAFGGWPLDDHHPDGFYHAGNPNVWGRTPAPYGIPYRSLYSRNISNLFFAGRNISMTHAAMSSARVMATCALLGEAVGEAANVAREFSLTPHGVYAEKLDLLQQRLMEHGCFLPRFSRTIAGFCQNAALTGEAEDLSVLRDGIDRNNHTYGDGDHSVLLPLGKPVTYTFDTPVQLENIHFAFDSDLDRNTLPGDSCERRHSMRANRTAESPTMCMPKTLVKRYRVTGVTASGETVVLAETERNLLQCVNIPVVGTYCAVSFIPLSTWDGDETDAVRVFSFDVR